jgi:hypothetical protein
MCTCYKSRPTSCSAAFSSHTRHMLCMDGADTQDVVSASTCQ